MNDKTTEGLAYIIVIMGAILIVVGLDALFAIPIWILWNLALPDAIGVSSIGFFQAWMIKLLCSCLFKSNITVNNKD